jgi:hypothetical protein
MKPHTLPLTLTVVSVSRSDRRIEANCRVVDADGVSVEYVPLEVGPQRTPAELCAILQSHVSALAESLLRREKATRGEALSEEATDTAFEGLVGREFTGSVTT